MTTAAPAAQPRLEPGTIERTRLLGQLAQARHKTCLLILGPAGSGKTSLALQWRAQALQFGHDVAWLTAQPGENGPALLDPLFLSLDRVDPEIAREARLLYNRATGMRPDAIAIALLRGLLGRSRPLVLVLDDWQNVADTRAHEMVQTLLEFAPPQLRLVIVSRTVPPLSLARLRDDGALAQVGPGDLRFTLEEVQAFVQARLPRGASGVAARHLLELTDGWAAGLQLVTLDPGTPASPVQNAHDFAAYFNREVLYRLDEATLDTMTRLAAARGFNQALASALAPEDLAPTLFDRLRSENLFVMPQDDDAYGGWYRFHPLFRELLLERFERLPTAERERTHLLLARWFGDRRHLPDAVHHAVAAGDLQLAVDWVDRRARELFLNGDLQQLVRAVAELPRTILNARPSLLLWIGWTQLCYHQYRACHETIASLRARAADSDENRAHIALLSFSLALQEDDLDSARALLPDMETMRHGTDAVLVGGRRNLLGWMYAHVAEYDQARAVMQGPPPLREDGSPLLDSPFGHLITQSLMGLSWLYDGNARRAEPVLRDALAQAEQALGRFSEPACNAAAYLSAALYEVNNIAGLRQLLDGRLDTMERVVMPDARVTLSVTCARLHILEGNPREALEALERMEETGQRRHLDRMLALSLSERVRCLVHMGDQAGARLALRELQALAARHSDRNGPVSVRINGLAHFAAALVHAAAHEDRDALHELGEHGRYDTPLLQRRDRAAAIGLRGILLVRVGQHDSGLQMVREGLLLAQRHGQVRMLLDLGPELMTVAQECVQLWGATDPVLAFHVHHLQQNQQLHKPVEPTRAVALREPLSERESEILRALAHSMSNKRIAQVLGVSPETVKWHLRNIYAKLGVVGRDDAVARARDLALVQG